VETLTDRELVVLQWLATPMTLGLIASELGVSRNTVKTHVAHIHQKLGVTRRNDAVECARTAGLLPDRSDSLNYESLMSHTSAAITVVDAGRRLVWASPAVRDVFGAAPRHGGSVWQMVHPDDRDLVEERCSDAFAQPETAVNFECRLPHADGSWRRVKVHLVNRLRDPGVRGFVGTTHEVSAPAV
jgi:PAS domain S-box-containing protein